MSLVEITPTVGNTLWAAGGPTTPGQPLYVDGTVAAQLVAAGEAAYVTGTAPVSPPSSGGGTSTGTGTGSTTGASGSTFGWFYAELVAGTDGAPAIPSTGFVTAFCRNARVLDEGPGQGTGTMIIGSGGQWLMLSGAAVLV